MKNGRLVKEGKNWYLEGEKRLPVMGDFSLSDDMSGQIVEFDNAGGPVKLIRYNEKDYTKQPTQHQDMGKKHVFQKQHGGSHTVGQQYDHQIGKDGGGYRHDPARAPYNFVPLNEQVVPAEAGGDFDSFAEGRLSGYIDLEIEAVTDIFIRGELEKFFKVNGKFAIPGSSLRGLVRSLVEMVSYSRMEMVEKKRKLFFRNISDPFYNNIFLSINNKTGDVKQNSKAGWLKKLENKYFVQIAPSIFKIDRRKLQSLKFDLKEIYQTKDIWFDPNNIQPIHKKEIRKNGRLVKTLNLHYNKIIDISEIQKDGFSKAKLLITGLFGASKHFQWIIPYPQHNADPYDVTDLMQEYQMDENRDENADLIKALQRASGQAVPCFFIPGPNGEPVAIGHTGIFRHPYKHAIGHAVKQKNKEVNIDIAKSLFGFADTEGRKEVIKAGKVFFEDAFETETPKTEFGALKILSSPKPTSFQLYLEQPTGNSDHHWGTDEHKIRGYKMYWHSKQDWKNSEVLVTAATRQELISKALREKNTQFTVGEVLKSGAKFSGRIRFDNLTEAELGALLLVLDLPNGCAHKLGMGKSLGMGSVRIRPTLKLINRKNRYEMLFDSESLWSEACENYSDMGTYKKAFAAWIGQQTGKLEITSDADYWVKDVRMKELKHLLTLEQTAGKITWENRTRYMEIERNVNGHKVNEYKTRPILPKPSEVTKPHTYLNE